MSLQYRLACMANNELAGSAKFTLSAQTVAARKGVSVKMVSAACRKGLLKSIKSGGVWLIDEESCKNWRSSGHGRKRT